MHVTIPQGTSVRELLGRQVLLTDDIRPLGLAIIASRGGRKSTFLGGILAWQDFQRNIPSVIADPTGSTIAVFLDRIMRLKPKQQAKAWARVRYVGMAGRDGYVMPMPILAQYDDESLWVRSTRFAEIARRMDASLDRGAPILGANSMSHVSRGAGIILGALGLQITELADLLSEPKKWEEVLSDPRLDAADAVEAARYLRDDFSKLSPNDRKLQIASSIAKLDVINWDPISRAIYGADRPAFTWQEVVDNRLTVLLDYGGLEGERLRLGMLWYLRSFIEWLKRRGEGYHHTPVSLVIDELPMILSLVESNHELIAGDFQELIAAYARSHRLWLSMGMQELTLIPEQIQRVVLQSGTLMFGATSDIDTAMRHSRRFTRYDPYLTRKTEIVYGSDRDGYYEIDQKTTEYGVLEQHVKGSERFLDGRGGELLVGMAGDSGGLPTTLQRVDIKRYDNGLFPDATLVREAKRQLSVRDGVRVEDITAQIRTRVERNFQRTGRKVEDRIEMVEKPLVTGKGKLQEKPLRRRSPIR